MMRSEHTGDKKDSGKDGPGYETGVWETSQEAAA